MIYILRQRLIAQKIHGSKAQKVLDDMLREICAEGFIDTLFLPQEVHPMKSVRKSFDRLAHCSTMKLNQSSMDRLFMLMVMVFKYQLLMCKCPREIIEVMLNHVTGMLNTAGTPELASMLTKCSEKNSSSVQKHVLGSRDLHTTHSVHFISGSQGQNYHSEHESSMHGRVCKDA